ncbi:peptide chain release factor N(5)-glutamine methyltransferase [Sediminibacterium salmoneum]|uniref:peptide chain release factor N(5)-glutamine methyltransferase n=1 Tax=Sediminibacterium salmoneum TaxID=426421 RepID=UPI00047BC08C|nr:peptide chain release factor N(5)-glutamine methyltransferase [Sediminibacterium salmoneum]
MTILEAKQYIIQSIQSVYGEREAGNIAVLLIEYFTGYSRMNQFLEKDTGWPEQSAESLEAAVLRLQKGEPIQYIMGKTWFYGLELKVNHHTLIPRPETEELVELAIQYLSTLSIAHPRILEVGTGSGCISLAIASRMPKALITAIDISEEALKVAKENAKQIQHNIHFKQLDFLNKSKWASLGQFDIIISNPPYIKQTEASSMHNNVLAYEPHTALFVADNDPLIFYQAIAEFSKAFLKKPGAIFVEINEQLGKETKAVFEPGYPVTLHKDMQGKERMIAAYQN